MRGIPEGLLGHSNTHGTVILPPMPLPARGTNYRGTNVGQVLVPIHIVLWALKVKVILRGQLTKILVMKVFAFCRWNNGVIQDVWTVNSKNSCQTHCKFKAVTIGCFFFCLFVCLFVFFLFVLFFSKKKMFFGYQLP